MHNLKKAIWVIFLSLLLLAYGGAVIWVIVEDVNPIALCKMAAEFWPSVGIPIFDFFIKAFTVIIALLVWFGALLVGSVMIMVSLAFWCLSLLGLSIDSELKHILIWVITIILLPIALPSALAELFRGFFGAGSSSGGGGGSSYANYSNYAAEEKKQIDVYGPWEMTKIGYIKDDKFYKIGVFDTEVGGVYWDNEIKDRFGRTVAKIERGFFVNTIVDKNGRKIGKYYD